MRCILYMRVSTQEQAKEGFSLRAQEERLRSYALSQGWEVARVLVDDGYSGKDMKRPGVLEVQDMVLGSVIDVIVVYKLDRLTRNLLDLLRFVDKCRSHNVGLVSCTEPINTTTPSGELILNMLGSVAQFERGMISERVKAGMEQKVKEGGFMGSVTPFGYRREGSSFVINSKEASLVVFIFQFYKKYKSLRKVYSYLSKHNIKPEKGKEYTKRRISLMLKNKIYKGEYTYNINGNEYINTELFPPIVNTILFDKVNEIMIFNKNNVQRYKLVSCTP